MHRWHIVIPIVLLFICTGCGKSSRELSQLAEQSIQQKNYQQAVQLLEQAVKRAPSDSERTAVSDRLQIAKNLLQSKTSYEEGLQLLKSNQFAGAYEAFDRVLPVSEHFDDAKAKKQKCGEQLSNEALRKAASAYGGGDIKGAISVLKEAKRYENPAVGNLLLRYKTEGAAVLLRKASHLYNSGKYTEGISVLKQAEELGSKEASRMHARYAAAKERQEKAEKERQARLARQQEKEQAKYYEGEGKVQIAVYGVKLRRATDSHVANSNSTFVYVGISAKNVSDDIVHVNPHDFTLADSNGDAAPHESDTYSLGNYLNAVDLRPGQSTSGWLIFCMLKDNRYTLGYQGFGGAAEKAVIP